MLSSELIPQQDSLAFVKNALHNDRHSEDQIKELRELMSSNVIVAGWIRDPCDHRRAESIIDHLRERVDRFESNRHLRVVQHDFRL